MSGKVENFNSQKLGYLVSEILARKGYTIDRNPVGYDIIDHIAVTNKQSMVSRYFVVTTGKITNSLLTEQDIRSTLSNTPSVSGDDERLLVITGCNGPTSDGRKIIHNNDDKKRIWYSEDIMGQLSSVNSLYLTELYKKDRYMIDSYDRVEDRLNIQGIEVDRSIVEYISDETYHPFKIVACLELDQQGNVPESISKMPAVREFKYRYPDA